MSVIPLATARRKAGTTRRRSAEIIEAAARVFAQRGFHGTATQDIADVLGIRQASLYYYFRSKEAALELVCARGVEGFVDTAAEIAAGPGSAAERITQLIHSHLDPLKDRADFVRVFLKERQHLPRESRRRIGRLSRKLEAIYAGVLKEGVEAGEFAPTLDIRLATLALLGMMNAVPAWYDKERAAIDRIAAHLADIFLHGVERGRRRRG